ncbi:Short-chain dehydrogenase [Phytophthora megakarya]|uniref:Short-chain dehydrogenase n=1 Tax=Phytophthora megakarya TaxID=4795 RepID=A0A225VA52_9STRA|nr:Short-chain dehydrogenase [Phytophthora megakarya]
MPILKAKLDGVHQDLKQYVESIRRSVQTVEGNTAEFPAHLPLATYKMTRGINTVVDLWREWDKCLYGGPAVRMLEEQHGTKWCSSEERRFFNRRKRELSLIEAKAINIVSSKQVSRQVAVDDALATIDEIRAQHRKSLNCLCACSRNRSTAWSDSPTTCRPGLRP